MRRTSTTETLRRGWLLPAAALVCSITLPATAAPPAMPAPASPEITAAAAPEPPQRRRRPARPQGQQAPAPERVKEIQAALAERGFYKGEPSGKWDQKSQEAMKAFQEANSLRVTGKIDALSLQALGLGSEIAGAAPPRDTAASSAGQGSAPPR
jgi:peptidoglycan hydrolase-like protein with peptidoglycan-binding domain